MPEEIKGGGSIGRRSLVHMPKTTLAIIPCTHVLRPFCDYPLVFGDGKRRLDRRGNTRRDVVLHRKDIRQLAVVTLSPEMGTRCRIDQLAADAHALPGPAHAALQ